MKVILLVASFFAMALVGCDGNKGNNKEAPSRGDSTVTTLTDLASSKDIKKLLCQDWENKEDAEEARLSGSGAGLEMPYRGFSFFADATVVENPRDKIRFGKWTMNDEKKLIDIESNNGERTHYKIIAIGPKQMVLMNTTDKKRIEYRADGKTQNNPTDDPFHKSNNQWRIRPVHPEGDSAIKLRTGQCLLFYAKYLEDNAGRGGGMISFVGLPGCFKWYHGGISVVNKDKLEANWLNCYYNKEQALKGHAMLERIISKKYKWDKGEKNWVKQSATVVKQMYDSLRAL